VGGEDVQNERGGGGGEEEEEEEEVPDGLHFQFEIFREKHLMVGGKSG
jgi:hypothetical protein